MKRSARDVALAVLDRVEHDGAWAAQALETEIRAARLEPRDRALAARIAFGAIKLQRTLDHVAQTLGRRDVQALDPLVRFALRIGTYQLLFTDRVPQHAAVTTTVDLVKRHGGARASGLVNAILRRVSEGGRAFFDALPESTPAEAALRHSYPDWIAEMWTESYGLETTIALLAAGNEPAETVLRVNTLRDGARDRVEAELTAAEIPFTGAIDAVDAIVLDGPFDTAAARFFAEGDATPMSRAAQLIAPMLEAVASHRVLDACAAPGGKAGHLAALRGTGDDLVCVERDPNRAGALRVALDRLGAAGAAVVEGDVIELAPGLGTFDRILLDAPCSGLGTISSRPDVRWRREPGDVAALCLVQRRLLDALMPLLRPGGRLVYAVCTLGTVETTEVVAGLPVVREMTIWPHLDRSDGFYAAAIDV